MKSLSSHLMTFGLIAVVAVASCSAAARVTLLNSESQKSSSLFGEMSAALKVAKQWKPDSRLTFDSAASLLSYNFARCIATDDSGTVHVVWYDDRDGNSQVYYKRSSDSGATWGPDTRLLHDPAWREHPAVAVSGPDVYVVWHDSRNGNLNIFFKRSTDRGLTWEPESQLTSNTPGAAHASIAASGSSLHVVWGDHRDGEQAEVYTRGSSDNGLTWGPETRLSDVPYDSWVPTVAVSGRNVCASWVDTRDENEEEYFRRSTDGGVTWAPAVRLTNNAANSWAPSLVVVGEAVQLVWFDQQDSPAQPLDAEKKLDEAMALVGLPVEPAPIGVMVVNPEAAAQRRATEKLQQITAAAPEWVERGGDAARLQAIMHEFEEMAGRGASYMEKERKLDEALKLMGLSYTRGSWAGLPKIYYMDAMRMRVQDKLKQVQTAAAGWVGAGGDPKRLEGILGEFETMMQLATTEWEVYYRRSTDCGDTWGPITRLTEAAGLSQRPSIAASGDQLHIVWFDGRDGNVEVYYKRSLDAGLTWERDVRLTNAPGDSMHPSVAVSGSIVHVVWFDRRDGNAEIYYKRTKNKNRRPAHVSVVVTSSKSFSYLPPLARSLDNR